MTPQEIITALEKKGITQYRISKEIHAPRNVIASYARGTKPNMANANTAETIRKLTEFYEKKCQS